jgi:hypothetical protein
VVERVANPSRAMVSPVHSLYAKRAFRKPFSYGSRSDAKKNPASALVALGAST